MAETRDDKALADLLREEAKRPRLRQLDRDRTDVAVHLWKEGVSDGDIATVCGVRPWEVRTVLAGGAVR